MKRLASHHEMGEVHVNVVYWQDISHQIFRRKANAVI